MPPEPIRLTLEAVAIMCKEKPVIYKEGTVKKENYFDAGKRLMQRPKFLQRLLNYNLDLITYDTIEKVEPYIKHQKFIPQVVKYASSAAEGMCKWVRAVYEFYFINESILPKRTALKEAEENLRLKQERLDIIRAELEVCEMQLSQLKA